MSVLRYDCQINIGSAVFFASLKYVHNYIYKGHDHTTLKVEHDEIKMYIDAQYVSSMEAVWQLFHFPLHDKNPSVFRLQIHLPGQHLVTFDPDEPIDRLLERAANEKTTLTAFFNANRTPGDLDALARQFTYHDFPKRFVWDATHRA
jgi:hypothetical protein